MAFSSAPAEINYVEFVQARAMEISDLMFALETDKSKEGALPEPGSRRTTYIQRLPRHMRRRAMARNVKRVPRRLRDIARRVLAKTKPPKKPPSRKYRRRPSNILHEFVSRQCRVRWLETHVWHAKRFHIKEMWGFKIPWERTQRGFRAAYRDVKSHCVMRDISYLSCVQIEGPQKALLSGLNRLCSTKLGKTFSSVATLAGKREGRVTLYQPNSYPRGCIGSCTFLFKPSHDLSDTSDRVVWLWMHPTIEAAVIEILSVSFSLKKLVPSDSSSSTSDPKPVSFGSFVLTNMANRPTLQSDGCNNNEPVVKLTVINGSVLRFRLSGLASSTVLCNALCLCDDETSTQHDDSQTSSYCSEFLRSSKGKVDIPSQRNAWEFCMAEDSTNVADQTVLAVLVQDPRLKHRNATRETPCTDLSSDNAPLPQIPCPWSPIWDDTYRAELLKNRLSDKQLNALKSHCLLSTDTIKSGSVIPILLIRRSGCSKTGEVLGLNCGWDIVLPSGWGMPLWVALHYSNARAVGLHFSHCLALECGRFLFPDDWPDTAAGIKLAEEKKEELFRSYLRKPPNRRVDLHKANVQFPFFSAWQALNNSWDESFRPSSVPQSDQQSFFVIRDFRYLRMLVDWFSKRTRGTLQLEVENASQALVPFCLEATGKGTPSPFAMVCFPNEEDWKHHRAHTFKLTEPSFLPMVRNLGDSEESDSPMETESEGDTEVETEDHEVDLEQLFPKSRNAERSKRTTPKAQPENQESQTFHWSSPLFEQRFSRRVMGFVVNGSHSLSKAKNVAVGFCSLTAILKLATLPADRRNFVLFRNQTSAVYRTAHMTVSYFDE